MIKKNKHYLIIDFDSTFTQVEALDELCMITHNENANEVINTIKKLTEKGMNGEISIRDSLKERIKLINAHKRDLGKLVSILKTKITPSFVKNKSFINSIANNIYIVSNGFHEFIYPVVEDYGIKNSHVLANSFEYSKDGYISGMDMTNPLTNDNGKATIVDNLKLKGTIHVIGDGLTDYDIVKMKKGHFFYAFIENQHRNKVVEKADLIAEKLDKIISHIYR